MNENLPNDIRSNRRLLQEIAELCEHASLTGSLSGGAPRVAQRYNSTLERMVASGAVPAGLFTALPPDSAFGEIGVEARMLAAYLKGDDKRRDDTRSDPSILLRLAPFIDRNDLTELVRQQIESGTRVDMGLLTSLAPFMDKDQLGRLLREHMRPEPPQPPTPPQAPPASEPPQPPTERTEWPRHETPTPETTMAWTQTPPPVPKLSLHELLSRLKNPMITDQERDELIEQVRSQAME